jgi:hypothetical protein
LSGKRFNFEPIEPRSFAELATGYLEPGRYPYYSKVDPNIKGEIIVTIASKQ